MAKTEPINNQSGEHAGWMIFCTACNEYHVLDERWSFNGDMEKPTFSPSLLIYADKHHKRCHSFITDGQIQYLADCTHGMAGQTVDLPDID